MNLCRFEKNSGEICVGLATRDAVLDLTAAGVGKLSDLLEANELAARLGELVDRKLLAHSWADVRLLPPLDRQEVWAVGVTYLRSKQARMSESDFSSTAYDKVYEAPRPELFFKAMPDKVVGPGDPIGIRRDATWSVPEPELVLVLNSRGEIAGYTIGNDVSSRDIEGENLLYLPQAKIYDRSCSVGPFITVGVNEVVARTWKIGLEITRDGAVAFQGSVAVSQIKRSFGELAEYLFRSQTFPHGALLFTGTGIVPSDDFTLQAKDHVRIAISGIGELENPVIVV